MPSIVIPATAPAVSAADAPAVSAADACPTCCRRADQPYRVYDESGKVLQGCVANFHTGHVLMRDAFWHNRPEAKRIRAKTAAFYRSLP